MMVTVVVEVVTIVSTTSSAARTAPKLPEVAADPCPLPDFDFLRLQFEDNVARALTGASSGAPR